MNIIHGDCLEELKKLEDNSIDAVITDPPYGLFRGAKSHSEATNTLAEWAKGNWSYSPKIKQGYMESDWDKFVPSPELWAECLRVLKPGGHAAVFSGARTVHIMGFALMLAGFEVRDTMAWIQGTGFPRSLDYGTQIKKLGHEELGEKYWDWRSDLKPLNEPILLVRKPLSESSIAKNIVEHGTGALNVGDCRFWDGKPIPSGGRGGRSMFHGAHSLEHLQELAAKGAKTPDGSDAAKTLHRWNTRHERLAKTVKPKDGRWPGNVIIDDVVAEELGDKAKYFFHPRTQRGEAPKAYSDDGELIQHQTVKPLGLMEWLVTLVTPPNGIVLDPFAGSGTTLQAALNKGFTPIGIEQDADYIKLIEKRLEATCTTHKN